MTAEEIPVYIIFDEQRGENTFREQSPNCSAKWGNIVSVDDIRDAEYLVVINTPMGIDISQFPPERMLFFRHEPDAWQFLKGLWDRIAPKGSHLYPNSEWWTIQRWQEIHKTYDELKNSDFPKKTKDLSAVMTNYGDGTQPQTIEVLYGHQLRIQFLLRFLDKYPDGPLTLYGNRLSGSLFMYPCNKGYLYNKYWGLKDYRYTFAFENAYEPGWFTEKVCEPVLLGCMPIFWGDPRHEELFPEGSFIRLDITKEDAVDRVIKIINSDYREQHLDDLREGKRLILDKYNVWPSLQFHISNLVNEKID